MNPLIPLLLVAATANPEGAIIRRCFDSLQVQMYVEKDRSGTLWYGSPMIASDKLRWTRLDPKALDQVCPERDPKIPVKGTDM